MNFFIILTIITIVYCYDDEKNIKNFLTENCEKIQLNATQQIMKQLETVDKIKMENFHLLWILINNNLENNKKFIEHLTDFMLKNDENKNFNKLSVIKENILLYSLNETNKRIGYLLYRPLNKRENELNEKYFLKKQMDMSLKVNILNNSRSINLLISSMNNNYENFFKNYTNEYINKSEIDLWTKLFMKSLSHNNRGFLNFTKELKFSKEINCSINMIFNDLIVIFQKIADCIFIHYFNLEENTTNNFISQLTEAHVILNKAIDETCEIFDNGKNVNNLKALITAFSLLKINVSENYFALIVKKMNQLNFFYMAMNKTLKASFLLNTVKGIIDNEIGASILWYEKLNIGYVTASRSLSKNIENNMKRKVKEISKHVSFKALNSKVKERELKKLEHHSFNRDLRKECVKMNEIYKLEIHGDFINFKDIPDIELCKGETRYIELFARNQLVVDCDLIRIGDMVQVVAIAPKWIVSGLRWIDLRGAYGEDYEMESAEDGQLGLNGEDGLPGLPGGTGGIFIGIANEIINIENLQILADGGLGGNGQNGGKGGNGPVTRQPTIDDYDKVVFFQKKEKQIIPLFEGFCFSYYFDLMTISFGGDGGNGGKGGIGGNPGQIFLVQLNKTFQEHSPKQGGIGYDGLGGAGGVGNFRIESIEEKCSTEINDFVNCENCTKAERIMLAIHNGSFGQDGSNIQNIKNPINFLGFREIAFVINDYKTYTRCYLDSRNEELLKFYANLLENDVINEKYNTFGLLDELKGLEKQYLHLMKKIDLLPMYENLQKRIEKYIKHGKNSNEDYFVALNYAYTAALTRSSRLIETGYFVPNLENFIESVSRNLDKLKDNIVQYTANQLGEDYKQNIEKKISEARIIIDEQLDNEIKRINKLMKRKIYDLIRETIDMRNESQEKKDSLKKNLMQQTIVTLLKSALVGISALIPGGQAAAIVAFTGIQIGETFAPQYLEERYQTKIPIAVGNRFAGALEFIKKSKIEEYKILQNDIEFLKNQNDNLNNNLNANRTILVKEIKNLDKKIETLMKKKENDDTTDYTKVIDIVSKLRAYFNLKQKNTDAVERLENDTEKKEKLKDNIYSVKNDIEKLQTYQNRIYNELIPVFDKMHQDLPSNETLHVQSIVELDISKWKVQTALKNIKIIFQQFTKGFNIENDMNQIIENLEDTINTLISIYDQIQNFQQEKKLSAYIKQLTNIKLQNFNSKDKILENSVLETRFIIRINLALIQYEKIFNSFKQFVFPFANKYMNDIYKPSIFEISTNISLNSIHHWFAKIIENVYKIKNKINTIQATIVKNSKFNEKLEYGNKHQGEFYLWKNETHYNMITNLLNGNEVLLFPDARKFPHFAVKFKKIRIKFLTKNNNEQKQLTELLNSLEMKMTHEGNSYYTCGNKMYLISHSPITLIKTFNESYQGESDSVQKLANGDDLVSPFATWRVKISRSTGGIEKNYFANFQNKLDLVLEGIGTYIQVTNIDVCNKNTNLTEYYEEYIPIVNFDK